VNDRAVSSPIGIVLIIGMTIASVAALFVVGGAVIDDTRADAERSQMENAMSSFSSKASLVGLGESGNQRFSLGRVSEGEVRVDERSGNASVYAVRTTGERVYFGNVSMGAVVYRNGDTEIAYQGGGVWDRTGGYSRMISPPEFHYRTETLTFPIINVSGNGAASGDVSGTVRSVSDSRALYPNATEDETFTNPVTNGTVYVEIESRYCGGWESFFRDRSEGGLNQTCAQGANDTLVVDLTAGLDAVFGEAVTTEATIEDETGNLDIQPSSREGVIAPSASDLVDSRIDDCSGCSAGFSGTLEAGTHYTEDATDFEAIDEINTTDGDVDVIINDTTGGIDGAGTISVTGDGNATVYVKTEDDIELGGGDEINPTGSPDQFLMYVHSDVSEIKISGKFTYRGGIYAPKTKMKGDQGNNKDSCKSGGGNVNITGSVVVQELCFNSATFTHDPVMDGIDPDVEFDTVEYLHVSENAISVDLG
jgi:hypothetical protein